MFRYNYPIFKENKLTVTKTCYWKALICVRPCIVDICGEEKPIGLHLSLWTFNLLPCTCQPTTSVFGTTHRALELI
jgi:hypothetical protein